MSQSPRRGFRFARGNAGRLQAITGAVTGGVDNVELGIAVCEKAVQTDPKNVLARSELALLYWNAGKISLMRKNAADALRHFEMAEKLQQELVNLNPRDLYNLANLADTYTAIGLTHESMNETSQAHASFKRGHEIWTGLKEKDLLPGYYSHKPDETLRLMDRAGKTQ